MYFKNVLKFSKKSQLPKQIWFSNFFQKTIFFGLSKLYSNTWSTSRFQSRSGTVPESHTVNINFSFTAV
jgi:hypothetical protein